MGHTYREQFAKAVETVRGEGRYRVFQDIRRKRGAFPVATWYKDEVSQKDITVWCSNDYLGMGQNECVIEAVKSAVDQAGTGSGGTRNISGTTVYHKRLEAELSDLHAKEDALVFTSAYIANERPEVVIRESLPFLAALVAALLICLVFPAVVTTLPAYYSGG